MNEFEKLTMQLVESEQRGDMVKWNLIAQQIAELEGECDK